MNLLDAITNFIFPERLSELQALDLISETFEENCIAMITFEKLMVLQPTTELTIHVYSYIRDLWTTSNVFAKHYYPITTTFDGNYDWATNISPTVAVMLASKNIIVPYVCVKLNLPIL